MEPAPQRRPLRALVAGLAAVVVAVPIVVGILISGGGGGSSAPGRPRSSFTPVKSASIRPSAHRGAALPAGHGALVAIVSRATTIRLAPGGRAIARLKKRDEFGSPEVLWVARRSGPWLGVVSTLAGNGHVGWIPRSATALTRVPWEIKVSLSARKVTVLRSGTVIKRYTVAVGAPGSPTPTGRFAVTDRLFTGDPGGPYGCCILALSAKSPHPIQGWGGGNRIAIHSTPEVSSIGEAASHGCLRLTLSEGRWLLGHIPLGTPTIIRA